MGGFLLFIQMGLTKEQQREKYRKAGAVSITPKPIKPRKKRARISYKVKTNTVKDSEFNSQIDKGIVLFAKSVMKFGKYKGLTVAKALERKNSKAYFIALLKSQRVAFDITILEILK